MTIRTENRIITITLRLWHGGWNAGFDPDIFSDVETWFPLDHPKRDEYDAIIATDKEVGDLIEWWEEECENANKGIDGDGLCGLSDDAIERGDEFTLLICVNKEFN